MLLTIIETKDIAGHRNGDNWVVTPLEKKT